jgi:hypothetical protein
MSFKKIAPKPRKRPVKPVPPKKHRRRKPAPRTHAK